jgi:hypothetical protein
MKTRFLIAMIVSFGFIACGSESTPSDPSATQPVAASETNGQPDGVAFACQNPYPDCTCCYGRAYPFDTCDGCGTSGCDQSCTTMECWPVSCSGSGCDPSWGSRSEDCYVTGSYTNTGVCCF